MMPVRWRPAGALVGAAAWLALAAPPLTAQEPRDTTALPDVVVTATRYPVPPESVSATLTVLHGDEIRAQGLRFVGDALRQVPGVQVVQGGGFGAATSLFVRGGESDYTKVLIDGVPANDPGGAFDFGSLTTDNIERIEILRGPASVLYGSDAMTGVVQIITRRGSGAPAVDASAEAGTYGTVRWEGSARGGSERVGWSGSLSRLTSDGIYPFNSQYRNTVASAFLRAQASTSTRATLSVRFHDGAFHFPTDFTGAPVDSNQFTTERMTTISLDIAQALPAGLRAELLLGRNETTRGFDDTPPPGSGSTAFSTSEASIDRNTVDGRLMYTGIPSTTLLSGVVFDDEHEQDFSRSDGAFGPSSDSFEASRTNWGYYLQATAQPLRRVQLTAGGRLDDNERFGNFWTYRVAALGFLTSSTRIRASAGKGFKEPAFFDTYSTSPFAVGNPDLRPERSRNLEAALEQDLAAGHVTLSVTGFSQRFRDLIQFASAPPAPGAPNFFNIAAANASGIETGIALRRLGPVEASASYTWLHTKVTDAGFDSGSDAQFVDGQRLIRRPEHAVTARVSGAVHPRLQLGAALNVIGSRDDLRFAQFPDPTRRITLAGYTTVDLSSRVTLLQPRGVVPGLALHARIENLFDEQYEQVANFRSPGRTVIVGVSSEVR
ncbi:MAG TPA: TonB-dependent receptor [Gemmatimonadales bacterium]|nr:TonB-dependent receptor [Gemmatimonadales bacterium]